MTDHDDGRDWILSQMPKVAQDTRAAAWVLQDRWRKAKRAAATRGQHLATVRCATCRAILATVHSTDDGPLFTGQIKYTKLDQLDMTGTLNVPPWIRDADLRSLPEAVIEDDGLLLSADTKPRPPLIPSVAGFDGGESVTSPGDDLRPVPAPSVVMDLLTPPPAPDAGINLRLWVRCKDHPYKMPPANRPLEYSDAKRNHPLGATAVDREVLATAIQGAARLPVDHLVSPIPET